MRLKQSFSWSVHCYPWGENRSPTSTKLFLRLQLHQPSGKGRSAEEEYTTPIIHTKAARSVNKAWYPGQKRGYNLAWVFSEKKITTSSTRVGLLGSAQQSLTPALTERNKYVMTWVSEMFFKLTDSW